MPQGPFIFFRPSVSFLFSCTPTHVVQLTPPTCMNHLHQSLAETSLTQPSLHLHVNHAKPTCFSLPTCLCPFHPQAPYLLTLLHQAETSFTLPTSLSLHHTTPRSPHACQGAICMITDFTHATKLYKVSKARAVMTRSVQSQGEKHANVHSSHLHCQVPPPMPTLSSLCTLGKPSPTSYNKSHPHLILTKGNAEREKRKKTPFNSLKGERKQERGKMRRPCESPVKTDTKQKLIAAFAQAPFLLAQTPFLFAHSLF